MDKGQHAVVSNMEENLDQKDYELFKSLYDISKILNTGLTPDILFYCLKLCESGVHPQALAHAVRTLKHKVDEHNSNVKRGSSEEFNLTSNWQH